MKRVLGIFAQPRHFPWIALVIAAVVLLFRLGSYGFWEPREIAVADRAKSWLESQADQDSGAKAADSQQDDQDEATPGRRGQPRLIGAQAQNEPGTPETAEDEERSAASKKRAAKRADKRSREKPEPPFHERLIAHGIDNFGYTELGARLPLALLGLLAVMAAYFLAARASSARAGLIAAMVALSFPLIVLQSRQLTSEIGAVTGSALLFLGLFGMAMPSRWKALASSGRREIVAGLLLAVDLAACVGGAVLAYWSAGPLLGLAPPLLGFAIAVFVAGGARRHNLVPLLVALVALGAGLVALAVFMHGTFDWIRAGGGDWHLFGWTLEASTERQPALGGIWRDEGDVQTPFSVVFEHIAFGTFPWIAVAPIALVLLAIGWSKGRTTDLSNPDRSARELIGPMLFAWAALAWLAASVVSRKVAPVHYPALIAVAVAVAVWLDGLLERRAAASADATADASPRHGSMPLLALFALLASIVIGKDLVSVPNELTSLTAGAHTVEYPEGARVHVVIGLFGVLFGIAVAAGLFLWRGPYRLAVGKRIGDVMGLLGRYGLHAAVVIGLVFGLFLSQVWLSSLSERMSARDVLGRYRELKQPGDQLGIHGNLGKGASYYAEDDYTRLKSRKDLLEFLRRDERVFVLTRSSSAEKCYLHKEAHKKAETPLRYHILDDDNAQLMLISNQLRKGETDQNPLVQYVRTERPADVGRKMSVNFDGQIELIGVDIPATADKGDTIELTFYYRVIEKVSRPWKVFVHIDGPASRIIGDHKPLAGLCSLSTFEPGDYLIDRFEVKAGGVTDSTGMYKVWTGFFVGSAGNWTNMKVSSGEADRDNRVHVGSIRIQ